MNLRSHIATNGLKTSIEGNYGLPVILIPPDGVPIKTDTDGNTLKGQVIYDREELSEEGDLVSIKEIRITLRKSALSRVPVDGEKWGIQFPLNPATPETLTTMTIDGTNAITDGGTLGFITLRPIQADQV